MSKVIAAFLIIRACLFTPLAFAAECEPHLTHEARRAIYRTEVVKVTASFSALRRGILRAKAYLWQSRILEDCISSGGCTGEHIAAAVRLALAPEPATSNLLGYGFLVGGMVANAAAFAGITTLVNPQTPFTPTVVGFVLGQASLISANLLSSFSDPIFNRLRKLSYKLKGQGQPLTLDAMADGTQASYTLREQNSIDRIFQFRMALRSNFDAALTAYLAGDLETQMTEIADVAINGYLYFDEIDPREPGIVNAVWASYLSKTGNRTELKDPIFAIIKARYPKFRDRKPGQTVRYINLEDDKVAQAYFRAVLDAWLSDT